MMRGFVMAVLVTCAAVPGASAQLSPAGTAGVATTGDSIRPQGSDSARSDSVRTPAAAALPSFVLKGFVGATVFYQNAAFGFGNGQSAVWVRANPTEDGEILGGDIRNTRLTLQLGGEPGRAVRTGALLEVDFFGGYNGASGTSDEQPLPRLRLAYADLTKGQSTLRVGQFWTLLMGNVPVSVAHIAFPLGFGSGGVIGWRNPGVLVQHSMAVAGLNTQLQAAAMRGSWNGPGDVLDQQSAGETSRVPQLELRLDVARGTRWSGYVVAHIDRKDLSGYGADTAALGELDGRALALGAKTVLGRVTVQGNGYIGRAIAQQMGQLGQYGDIGSRGGWLQLGVALSPELSVWAFAGGDDPSDREVLRAVSGDARLENRLGAASLQYTSGDYSAGLEWLRARTTWARPGDGAVTHWDRQADQLSFSVVYRFNSATRPASALAAR